LRITKEYGQLTESFANLLAAFFAIQCVNKRIQTRRASLRTSRMKKRKDSKKTIACIGRLARLNAI